MIHKVTAFIGGVLLVIVVGFGWLMLSGIQQIVFGFANFAEPTTTPFVLLDLYCEGVAIIAMVWVYRKRPLLTGLTWHSHQSVRQYGWGLLAGCASFGLIWLITWLAGGFDVSVAFDWSQVGVILAFLGGYAVQSMFEELLCRGYIMGYWLEKGQLGFGIVFNSVIFMLLHALNPGFTKNAAIGIFLFGLLMSLIRVLTGSIWFSGAMHAAWNFAEGVLFGTSVSGMGDTVAILRARPHAGKLALVGDQFGIEASALSIGWHVLLVVAIGGWLWRRNCHSQKA